MSQKRENVSIEEERQVRARSGNISTTIGSEDTAGGTAQPLQQHVSDAEWVASNGVTTGLALGISAATLAMPAMTWEVRQNLSELVATTGIGGPSDLQGIALNHEDWAEFLGLLEAAIKRAPLAIKGAVRKEIFAAANKNQPMVSPIKQEARAEHQPAPTGPAAPVYLYDDVAPPLVGEAGGTDYRTPDANKFKYCAMQMEHLQNFPTDAGRARECLEKGVRWSMPLNWKVISVIRELLAGETNNGLRETGHGWEADYTVNVPTVGVVVVKAYWGPGNPKGNVIFQGSPEGRPLVFRRMMQYFRPIPEGVKAKKKMGATL